MTQTSSGPGRTYDNPLWPGPRLLVPISVECLLIGQPNQQGSWADLGVDYRQLAKAFDPEPAPFKLRTSPPDTGAHLQVTLPAAFRNGAQQSDGSVTFPPIPNRWLILRSVVTAPGAAPTVTATVLQADFLGDMGDGTNTYPDPAQRGATQWLGRAFELASWPNPDGPAEPILLAMGPGSVSWVATYQNTLNVLSFHDPLTDVAAGTVAYAALGWYDPPGFDPLLGVTAADAAGFTDQDEWQTILSALKFTVGGAAGLDDAKAAWAEWQAANPITNPRTIPAIQMGLAGQSLCHGMVMGIDWKGPAQSYPRAAILDGQNPLAVAVGGTGFEAIAAWMAEALNQPDLEDLLLAVQRDLAFDYLKDPSVFASQVQDARFAKLDGGTTWLVAPPEKSEADRGESLQTVALSEEETEALTALNVAQEAVDKTTALIAGNVEELFALVYKLIQTPESPFGPPSPRRQQITDAIDAIKTVLAQLGAQQQTQQSTLDAALPDLKALLAADAADFVLSGSPSPQFRRSASPSVMIAGAQQDTRFLAPGDDGGAEDALHCRFTGQTVSSLTVLLPSGGPPQTIEAGDLASRIAFPPLMPGIPKELADYLVEVLLFDTGNARLLAAIAFAKGGVASPTAAQLDALAATITAQQTAPWAATPATDFDELTAGAAVGFGGIVPLKRSVLPWSPPWSPLLVDWQMSWYPSAADAAGMLADWSLEDLDFTWTGTTIGSQSEDIFGRSVLGTRIAAGLAAKLEDFVKQDPNFAALPAYQQKALSAALAEIGQFDIVTTAMPDFNSAMLMQRSQMTQLTDADTQSYLDAAASLVPVPGNGTAPGFYPLRAGHVVLKQLWIVDVFGQILRATNPSQDVMPIRAQSVVTPDVGGADNARFVQLAPSVAQGNRLLLRLIDAYDDDIATNSSDLTSPVAGWLLPNHLDDSVLVFDQAGAPLGELLPVETDSGRGIRWDPAPGLDRPLGAPPAIDNPHLLGFVEGLLAQTPISGDEALRDLLDVIDVTLWSRPASTQPANDNLAVLIGQPVAVVRADIGLELSGTPAWNQSWADTGKKDDGGATQVSYATHLGHIDFTGNGVLGYFLNDDYRLLNPLRGFSAAFGSVRRAVAARGGDAHARVARAIAGMPEGLAADQPAASGYVNPNPAVPLRPDGAKARLTVLMDPRGAIMAMSGILPLQSVALPAGSVAAMSQLLATFRIGPIMVDPRTVQMPLPGNVAGKWSWIARTGVSTWETVQDLQPAAPGALLPDTPPALREGWLGLVPKRPVGSESRSSTPSVEMAFHERGRTR